MAHEWRKLFEKRVALKFEKNVWKNQGSLQRPPLMSYNIEKYRVCRVYMFVLAERIIESLTMRFHIVLFFFQFWSAVRFYFVEIDAE